MKKLKFRGTNDINSKLTKQAKRAFYSMLTMHAPFGVCGVHCFM